MTPAGALAVLLVAPGARAAAPDLKEPVPAPAEVAPGDEDLPTRSAVARIEWERGDPMALATQIAGGDTATRVAGVRALGRLRDPRALDPLREWMDDPDPAVRVAVAEAMGFTPGAEATLRPWLARLTAVPLRQGPSLPLGLFAASSPDDAELAAVLVSLGRAGDARDVSALAGLVGARYPIGGAAARALGVLATRGVQGLDHATPALVSALSAPDPRTVEDAAWALSRAHPALGDRVAEVEERLRAGLPVPARAWLVKAAWPSLDEDARGELFLEAMTDAPRLVQVAVLQAIRPGDVQPEVLVPFLSDADGWVRVATVEALGRVGGDAATEALERQATEAPTPYEQASAVLALHRSDPAKADDASLALPVRAAWVATLTDRDRLVALATTSEEPTLRDAAAGALSEVEGAGASDGRALLGAEDALIREVGVELVSKEPATAPGTLVELLGRERDPEVRTAAWRSLEALLAASPPPRKPDPRLVALVTSAGELDTGAAAPHVQAVARRLGLPEPKLHGSTAVPIALAGGGAATIELRPESLADARAIRGAVVRTDQGTFVLALHPELAPLAVATFAALAEAGWYDGVVFHRVVPGFVVQTGDPRGDGWGGPGFELPDEDSEVPFGTGSVGIARGADRDTGGSQWFVTTSPQPHLTSQYTWLGEVVQGQSVVDHLEAGAVVRDIEIERLGEHAAPVATSASEQKPR